MTYGILEVVIANVVLKHSLILLLISLGMMRERGTPAPSRKYRLDNIQKMS